MTAWSHLPNAVHINQVLATLLAYPDRIGVLPEKVNPAIDAVWDNIYERSRDDIWNAVKKEALRNSAGDVVWGSQWNAARQAILTLVAYDQCARYLTMTADQLRVWGTLSDDPAAILLVPYVTFLEEIQTITTDLVL
jgi:hypothetical protein